MMVNQIKMISNTVRTKWLVENKIGLLLVF